VDNLDSALEDVRSAMDNFMRVLDQEIEQGQALAIPEEKMKSMLVAYIAIKDSGRIYLDWAEHYIESNFKPGDDNKE
jgi:NifU-like protein involved in Fe-S cluster formation